MINFFSHIKFYTIYLLIFRDERKIFEKDEEETVEDRIQLFIDQILTEKNKEVKKSLIVDLVEFATSEAKKIAEMGDFFEAAEIISSTANLLEEISRNISKELYKKAIEYWQEQTKQAKIQAKFLEVAEIYLRIADLYRDKFNNSKKEKEEILYAIQFLSHEADVRNEFNELEEVARIFQNIGALYARISNFKKAIKFNKMAIKLAKENSFYQVLSYTYHQLYSCFTELEDYNSAKEVLLIGIEYFANEVLRYENRDLINLNLSQLYQIIKKLYKLLNDKDNYISYAKKEASAYISIAQSLGNEQSDADKKGTLYRGAALCYREIQNNLIECASCFYLAGNFFYSLKKYQDASQSFEDAAQIFLELGNYQKSFELYIKAGLNYQKANNLQSSLENFLNAYNLTLEKKIDFNKSELYNHLIHGLNQFAKEKIKSKEFFFAATSILESLKIYSKVEDFNPILFQEFVRRISKNYYKAASFKQIRPRNIRYAYFLSALSLLLLKQVDEAEKIIEEIALNGNIVEKYKEIVKIIIELLNKNQKVTIASFPEDLQKLILRYEEVRYIIGLFSRV